MKTWVKVAFGVGIGVGSIIVIKKVTEKKYVNANGEQPEDKGVIAKIKAFVQKKVDDICQWVADHPEKVTMITTVLTMVLPMIEFGFEWSSWRSQINTERKVDAITRRLETDRCADRLYDKGWNDSGMAILDGIINAASNKKPYPFKGWNGETLREFKVQEV